MNKPIKVLIVDDSSTMRLILTTVLSKDPGIEIVGSAGNAQEAREAIKTLNPDVMTLDIEMPNMSGLDFLRKVMQLRPMPVIMVSTLSRRGSEIAMEALEIGAFDCVGKPSPAEPNSFDELVFKIKAAAKATDKIGKHASVSQSVARHEGYVPADLVVAIGSSTGGVEALQSVIGGLPENCPPVVVTQHMPQDFTRVLAQRLDKKCPPKIVEATHGKLLEKGNVYIAPGGESHLELTGSSSPRCSLKRADHVNGHRPSVDVLFSSVARVCGSKAVGIILTGMGNDGARGLLQMRQAGAQTIGQDEATSIVYGMPKAAFGCGAVQKQIPLGKIAREIISLTRLHQTGERKCLLPSN
jgi:two-component system, chemotaxis family, protein-glutamate methylesterase/glutaminase